MYFDGLISEEGFDVFFWITSLVREFKMYSVKLNFECTNNVDEYEVLLLGK